MINTAFFDLIGAGFCVDNVFYVVPRLINILMSKLLLNSHDIDSRIGFNANKNVFIGDSDAIQKRCKSGCVKVFL